MDDVDPVLVSFRHAITTVNRLTSIDQSMWLYSDSDVALHGAMERWQRGFPQEASKRLRRASRAIRRESGPSMSVEGHWTLDPDLQRKASEIAQALEQMAEVIDMAGVALMLSGEAFR